MTARHRVLVVDDSPENLLLVEDLLAGEYDVLLAAGGREALDIARALRPELILLDIVMPELDGYAVCRAIREDPVLHAMKVILVSGRGSSTERLDGYAAGADDYVTKPFEREELRAKIRIFLRLRHVEEVARMKDDLLALVGHETRTPLSAVLGALELLEAQLPTGNRAMAELHALATANASRLRRLLEASTLLGALRAGRRKLESVPVSALDLLARASSDVQAKASAAGVRLQVEAGDLPFVQGDPTQLPAAVRSLLEYAIGRSAPHGTVELRGGLDGDQTLIRVLDRGATMAPAELHALFEPFESQDVMQHTSTRGPGLDLALARAIVDSLGGAIEALSRPDGGLCLTIRLPVCTASGASHGTL